MASDHLIPPFIRRLMPRASEAELLDAAYTFKRYAEIVIEMYERLERENPQTAIRLTDIPTVESESIEIV